MKPKTNEVFSCSKTSEQLLTDLKNIYPDNGDTSITKNLVNSRPLYDLQIVVPVYNVDKYLEQCIESLINQKTNYKYKIIFINDGSTDNSLKILNKYHQSFVEIINQKNMGLACARNTGLKIIDAKFVCFVDSDDYVSPLFVEKMVESMISTNADIIECNKAVKKQKLLCANKKTKLTNIDSFNLSGFAWNHIYKSSIFDNLCFSGNYWFEDTINRIVIFPSTSNCYRLNEKLYYYRTNENGITKTSYHNLRLIETFYITQKLLNEHTINQKKILGHVEKQLLCNALRLQSLDKKIQIIIFFLTRDLLQNNFVNIPNNFKFLKIIESGKFNKYILYSRYIEL